MTNPLTLARQSLWDSIDNWPALADTFQKKARNDEDFASLDLDKDTPEKDNLPAIAIWTATEKPVWFENTNQKLYNAYDVRVWTPGWKLEASEEIAYELRRAFYQSHPVGDARTYITTATCHSFPVITWSFTKIRGGNARSQNMTRLNMRVELQIINNPRS